MGVSFGISGTDRGPGGIVFAVVDGSVHRVDNVPDVLVGICIRLEGCPILVGDVANAALNDAAVEGDLVSLSIHKDHVGPHGDILGALVIGKVHQHIGVLH